MCDCPILSYCELLAPVGAYMRATSGDIFWLFLILPENSCGQQKILPGDFLHVYIQVHIYACKNVIGPCYNSVCIYGLPLSAICPNNLPSTETLY